MRTCRYLGHHLACGLSLLAALLAVSTPHAFAQTATYSYDANGRLLVADYGGGRTYTYTYDKAGNILTETVGTVGPTYTLQVAISPAGTGTVTGAGLSCPTQCSAAVPQGQLATVTAAGLAGFQLLGWGGDASGSANPLTLSMTAATSLIAYFGSSSGSTDSDGVPDTVEMGPGGNNPGYDGDGDGVPDYQQGNVASFPSAAGGAFVTLTVPAGLTLASVRAVGNPSPGDAPASVTFLYGFFEFEVRGLAARACTIATLILPTTPTLSTYYRYGATPDNTARHWYEFMLDGSTGAQIVHEATNTRVALHLCDGLRGDDDLAANGTVLDQGGPGQRAVLADPIPTLNEWGLILLALMLGLTSLLWLRRQDRQRQT